MRAALPLVLTLSMLAADPNVTKPGIPNLQKKLDTLTPTFTFKLGGSPDWMVLTGDTVWISNARLKMVQRIDPATNQNSATVPFLKAPCSGLAAGFGSLWVPLCSKSGPGGLARIDLKTSHVLATYNFTPAESEGGVTFGAGSVWLVTKGGKLNRIDPASGAVQSEIALPAGASNPLYSGNVVWVTGFASNRLLIVDPASNQVVAHIPVGPHPRFLTSGGDSIWTLNQGDGSVTRVNMKSRAVTANIPVGIPGEGGEICYGFGAVWTTVMDVPLSRIDPKTNKVTAQFTGPGGDSVRAGFHSVWLTDLNRGLLWRFDPATT